MSINRRTDKKICGTYTMEYFIHKKNKILPFVAMWMDLENIMLSEGRQILYEITYKWNLENKTNVYSKTETDSQI